MPICPIHKCDERVLGMAKFKREQAVEFVLLINHDGISCICAVYVFFTKRIDSK